MNLVVVGGGPKALFCLERLIAWCTPDSQVDITVLDPQPLGYGTGYDVHQPREWRLNVTAAVVDTRWSTGPHPTTIPLTSFTTWRLARGEAAHAEALDPFPPRALVGEYLAEQWGILCAHLPATWTFRHLRSTAHSLARSADSWQVRCADGETIAADQVLLATGHAPVAPGSVYAAGMLPAVPAGSCVRVRGAALTFLDAALSLTEGRGGTFAEDGAALHYTPGPDPVVIHPFSRSGLFMVPKPETRWVAELALEPLRRDAENWLAAHPGDVRGVLAQVEEVATRYLQVAGNTGTARITELPARGRARSSIGVLSEDVAIAQGHRTPDAAWALGQAWRDLYPSIVASVSFEQCSPTQWQQFAQAARILEPVAFGPPLINARKLLAMHAAAVLDTRSMDAREAGGDADLDAVLPGPGIGPGLLQRAEAQRLIARAPGRRGVRVNRDLQALDAEGQPIPGLAAVGRPTEDVVLGNDTLNRRLHEGPERWAQALLSGRSAAGQ